MLSACNPKSAHIIEKTMTIIVVIGLVKNELFQDFVARVVFIVPILRWLLSSMSSINNDIERLNDLSKELLSDGDKDINELQ